MVGVLVDRVAQAPAAALCQQAFVEPGWRWWISSLAPWIGPLLSTAGSVFVAWWVFRRQWKKEQVQWVRDQKKLEWDEIHALVSDVWCILHPIFKIKKGELDPITDDTLFYAVRKLRLPLSHTKFITRPFNDSAFQAKFDKFFKTVAEKGLEIQGSLDFVRSEQANESNPEAKSKITLQVQDARFDLVKQLTNEFQEISEQLKGLMKTDLIL